MAANHERRLDRLEDVLAPKGRTFFIFDHPFRPGTVEREKAKLIESGSLGPHDQIIVFRWKKPAGID
jgi:hypothetical protein